MRVIVEIGYTHWKHASGKSWSSATSFECGSQEAQALMADWQDKFLAMVEAAGGEASIDYVETRYV